MEPQSIISYYPTYALLDEIIVSRDFKKLYLYLDLKNISKSLYLKDCALFLVENSEKSRFIDTSIFSSLISFLTFHKIYAMKRNIDIEFIIFFETGHSYYHLNIDKEYKANRKIDNLFGLDNDKIEFFFKIIQKNLLLISKALYFFPNIHIFHLQNLEADFIPYFLIRNNFVSDEDDSCHIIYSNDHDLYQTLSLSPNVCQYLKTSKYKLMLKGGGVFNKVLDTQYSYLPDHFFPLALAISGDIGDNIKHIKGMGIKTVCKFIKEIVDMGNGIDNIYNNVMKNYDIFDYNKNCDIPKIKTIIEEERKTKLISKNLKLVSFELLCRELDNPSCTEIIKKKEQILKIIKKENLNIDLKDIKKALVMNGVYLEEGELELLFEGNRSTEKNINFDSF